MTEQPGLNARTDALLRRMLRRENMGGLRKVLLRTRPEDLAAAMSVLTWSEQRLLYRSIEDRDQAAEVLSMLGEDAIRRVTEEMTEEAVVDLLERLEADDATDVVHALPDELRVRVLAGMDGEDQQELARLLAYPPDTAGGIMSTDFFAMPRSATCGHAIRLLQKSTDDRENVQYVYVVDEEQRLVGVVSLRTLVVHPPTTPLIAVMTRDPIAVHPATDQEEVARFVARYDLLALPVLDDQGKLVGIVTVDDVVDVIREEAAEDMFKMAGLSEPADPSGNDSLWVQTRRRAGWLLATIGGGVFAAEIIGSYEATLAQQAVLAGFIPVVMGMGGNVGIQSATVAVRGLATGHIQLGGALWFVGREARVGVLLGLTYGVLLGAYGYLRFDDDGLVGGAVGASICVAMSLASVLGAGIPVGLSRLRVDPAVATGPVVTTLVDVLGIIVYFTIARWLLGL